MERSQILRETTQALANLQARKRALWEVSELVAEKPLLTTAGVLREIIRLNNLQTDILAQTREKTIKK